MKVKFNNFSRQYEHMKNDIDKSFEEVMNSGYFILGKQVSSFEKEFARYCNSDYAIGVGNGLDAIYLSLIALGIGPDDEVLVPSNTYIATWIAVSRTGATPVPVEPLYGTFNINPEEIVKKISKKTKAIIPVDLFGQPCRYDEINKVSAEYVIKTVVDAAQSHGASYRDKIVGSLADVTAFSFYPTKNLGAYGDGGAIVSNNSNLINLVTKLRNYGTAEKYNSEYIGINSRLDELQAAFLRVKMKHLNEENKIRQKNASSYLKEINNIHIKLPEIEKFSQPVWHQFVLKSEHRDQLKRYLSKNEIDSIVHYPIPPHMQKAYSFLNFRIGDFPIAEKLANEALSIPIDPYLEEQEINYVIEKLNEFKPS